VERNETAVALLQDSGWTKAGQLERACDREEKCGLEIYD
jgi:hypothetical protein